MEPQEDGTLRYVRRMEASDAPLAPDQYGALRIFLEGVVRADRAQVVLRRN